MYREHDLVELVDADGGPTGTATVDAAHTPPGLLHRAFSVLIIDDDGRTLTQQRAAAKSRFPSRWANACCGHPRPGESATVAGTRRLAEELGLQGVVLRDIGAYRYTATDPATGLVECEYDHVLLGQVSGTPALTPDPSEVATTEWVRLRHLLAGSASPRYAPWLSGVITTALRSPSLHDLT